MPERAGVPLTIVILVVVLAAAGCRRHVPPPPSTPMPALAVAAIDAASDLGTVRVTDVVTGLNHPWGMAFMPDGSLLVTERAGFLRRVDNDGSVSAPIEGVPDVFLDGQAGLLDVALSPTFQADALVYLSYAEPNLRGNLCGTAVARARLRAGVLEELEVIFRQEPKISAGSHLGSRLVFDDGGFLWITLGENRQPQMAQDIGKLQGKLVRIRPDGSIPGDNPFVGRPDARPEIWSYGHRNMQGAALHPVTRRLWTHEHGPMGGDEINIPDRGLNYGWPIVTHGIDYSGQPVPGSVGANAPGMQPPHHVWMQSPALSGMLFYTADRMPAWRGNLFAGALAGAALIRLQLDGDRIVHEERLLTDLHARIRDVEQGPDGLIYVLTDADAGRLLRVELIAGEQGVQAP